MDSDNDDEFIDACTSNRYDVSTITYKYQVIYQKNVKICVKHDLSFFPSFKIKLIILA